MFSMLTSNGEIRVLAIDLLSGKKKKGISGLGEKAKTEHTCCFHTK